MEPVAEFLEDLQMYWLAYGRDFLSHAIAPLIFLGAAAEVLRRIARAARLRRAARAHHPAFDRGHGPVAT